MAHDALPPPPRPRHPARPRGVLAALAALAALAGCDDPVPPPSQGAVSFDLGGSNCPIMSAQQDLKLGTVDAQNRSPLVDGETGNIQCTVAPSGAAFQVNLQIGSGGNGFNLNGLIVPGQAAEALVSLRTDKTLSTYQSAPPGGCTGGVDCGRPCSVSFPAPSDPNVPSNFGVGPGRIWAAFQCPTLRDLQSSDGTVACSIPTSPGFGYLFFENCSEG
jgi:hypothetical protein